MVADKNMVYDGQFYKQGDEIWELGSLVATNVNGNIREYEGLSKDIDKLPHYDTLGTGSSAFFIDTGQMFEYEATTQMWYQL